MRVSTLVGCMAAIGALAAGALGAQGVVSMTPADAQPVTKASGTPKSPAVAALLGLVLPGAGHWYAGEPGRGVVIAAVYWAGVAVVAGGRTDRVGLVGGVAALGAVGTSVIDGALAAGRHNARLRVTAGSGGTGRPGSVRVELAVPW